MTPESGTSAAAPVRGAPGAYRILAVLALANLMNYYDRTVPSSVIEPIKAEFALTDTQIGLLTSSFTVVYALAGIVVGRMADTHSRRRIMAAGMVAWSLFTAASGGAWSFASLLLFRLGVGIGEASYLPAASAMIFDAFPARRRARAIGIFQLGVPAGLLAAFLSVGAIAEATGSWRVPFLVAAVPGFVLAALILFLPEPPRGASEERAPAGAGARSRQPIRDILRIRTLRRLILASIALQIPAYAVAAFLVPLLQRYFGLTIGTASMSAGVILGLTGIAGLLLGGVVADLAGRRSLRARMMVGPASLALGAPFILAALLLGPTAAGAFVALFAVGWSFQFFFGAVALPAVADVVEPGLRATAVAVYFAVIYLLGGAVGPSVVGLLSDWFAATATATAAVSAEAAGLRQALLVIVPAFLILSSLAAWAASRTVLADHERMIARQSTA
ncbi:spinster family MFS transporter [Nonomuraea rubra]|uniref:MFS family permease n=1 Tax=Nonomuraea rubra TaxID=46180 RepID=A0A7X0NVY5_9ACTN|nr:MFS transporter [Nonomuraea rubra]MBB6550567.1 MFS family permease [Nonomuraea rubra]